MLGLCLGYQTAIDADEPAGQGKRVHRIIAHDEKTVFSQAYIEPGQQPMTEVIDVAIQYRIGFDQPHGEQPVVYRCPQTRLTRDVECRIFTQAWKFRCGRGKAGDQSQHQSNCRAHPSTQVAGLAESEQHVRRFDWK